MPREHRTLPSEETLEADLLTRAKRVRGGTILSLSGVNPSLFRKESTGFYLLHARVLAPSLVEHLAVLRELYKRHLPIPQHLMRVDAELALVRGEWVLRGANPRTAGRRILYAYQRWMDASDDGDNFRSYSGKVIGTESTSRQVFGPADYLHTSLTSVEEEQMVERGDEDADLRSPVRAP